MENYGIFESSSLFWNRILLHILGRSLKASLKSQAHWRTPTKFIVIKYMLSHPIVQKKKSATPDKTARMPEKSYQDTVYVISVLFKTKQQRKHIKAGFSTHNCLIHTVTAGSKSLRGLNFA